MRRLFEVFEEGLGKIIYLFIYFSSFVKILRNHCAGFGR
jgi:hypothetical protein